MKIDTTGLVVLLIGVIGLVVVYSLRPPSGVGEALVMLSQGRESFIKEPLYQNPATKRWRPASRSGCRKFAAWWTWSTRPSSSARR
jgi:hypothetical protein